MAAPVRILHLHSSFSLGGKEARAVRLMNAFGDRASHVVISAMPDQMAAREAIDSAIAVSFPGDTGAPPLHGKPAPGRYWRIARYMQQFDLVLSYNWGSMDGVMAHRILSPFMRLPPLIHHEDGFNADESVTLNPKRNAFRRAALGTAHAVVVPSHRLETVARDVWRQGAQVQRISNGIAVADYAAPPAPDAIPGFVRRDGDVVIGTIAGLRTVKDLPLLVAALALLDVRYRLVIVGEGPERDTIMAAADAAGVADRVHLPGFMAQPWRYVGLFDLFALSSLSEQQPIAVMEAMAAGLPVVAPDVGDIPHMVAPANARFIVGDRSAESLAAALRILGNDPVLAARVGADNRAAALRDFDEGVMIARYSALYEDAMDRPGALRSL